jgi:hypothetical protein
MGYFGISSNATPFTCVHRFPDKEEWLLEMALS